MNIFLPDTAESEDSILGDQLKGDLPYLETTTEIVLIITGLLSANGGEQNRVSGDSDIIKYGNNLLCWSVKA